MAQYFMGIDTGTQGVRIGICDDKGHMMASEETKWETDFPQTGWAEQDPMNWWNGILKTMRRCCNQLPKEVVKQVKACCVCATSSTVLAVDKEGNPLMNAMMWMDARSKKEMEQINATGHSIFEYCGGETSFEWLVPKALWIKRNRKDIYKKCYKILEQLDWVNYKLSGTFAASICNATCKWNYVKSEGGFNRQFFTEIGLSDYEEKFITNVLKVGDPVGVIRKELAEEFGFSDKMVLVQGGIDAHMAMFGLNTIAPNKLGVIMGTSFVHLCLKQGKKPEMTGIWGPYDSAVIDDMWLLEGGQISAAGLTNWFRENFHIEKGAENPYEKLIDSLGETNIGADGITVLDFFQGNRTPYKDASACGVIYGLNIKHTWKHIYRAVIEAITFGTHNIIQNFEKQDCPIESITACGGVTKDKAWMQIIADVTGKQVVVNENEQAGVLGCCVISASKNRCYATFQEAADAMVHRKRVIEPDMKNHEQYKQPFERYLRLYQSLSAMMKD